MTCLIVLCCSSHFTQCFPSLPNLGTTVFEDTVLETNFLAYCNMDVKVNHTLRREPLGVPEGH